MEDDFILPEGESVPSRKRRFLLIVMSLLAAFILIALCIIALLVVEKREALVVLLSAPTASPAATLIPAVEGAQRTANTPAASVETATESPPTQETATSTVTRETHRIIIYKEGRNPAAATETPTPHSPHRVIRYGQAAEKQ